MLEALERLPVATLVHLFVAVVLGVDLVVNGTLSTDALTYAGIVEGGNTGIALGSGYVAGKKQEVAASYASASGDPAAQAATSTIDDEPKV